MSPLASLLAPATKDWGNFTGVLEELIGAESEAEIEIESQSETTFPQDTAKNTAPDCLEQIVTGQKILVPAPTTDIPETLTTAVSDSTHFDTKPPVVPDLDSTEVAKANVEVESPEPVQHAAPVFEEPSKTQSRFVDVPRINGETASQKPEAHPEKNAPLNPERTEVRGENSRPAFIFSEVKIPMNRMTAQFLKTASPAKESLKSAQHIETAVEPRAVIPAVNATPEVRDPIPELIATAAPRVPTSDTEILQSGDRGNNPSPDGSGCPSRVGRPGEGYILDPSPGPSGHPLPAGEGFFPRSPKPAGSAKNILEDLIAPLQVLNPVTTVPAPVVTSTEVESKPSNLIPEMAIVSGNPSALGNERRIPERLNLAEFGVTRFEYKAVIETRPSPVLQSAQMLQMVRTANPIREIKPLKLASGFDTTMNDASSQAAPLTRPAVLIRPDEIQSVRLMFEPPPPPPVVRSVSMDIGDPESQVHVVIRERNGNLNVQFGSTNERLREDLQVAGPMLMRELQRNNPMPVTLDFSNFGSATDADGRSRPQPRAKKFLKPDAEFADVVETAYRPVPSAPIKSL